MERKVLGSVYTEVSDGFRRSIYPIARCVKSEKHDLGVVEMNVNKLGNIYMVLKEGISQEMYMTIKHCLQQ